ncbi:MAG: SpoIVB peptidase [Clostridia bacterium]|nr:SpoIVB peptidase [Clostridia bacterium]
MKKRNIFIFVLLSLTLLFNVYYQNYHVALADNVFYLGGMPAGFELETRGASVVGLTDVLTDNGTISPSKNADIRVGDIILSIETYEINNANDVEKALSNSNEKLIILKRDGEILSKTIKPAKDIDGKYKLGVFIKNGINGIGTITYITNGKFASLGHPVYYKNEMAEIKGGKLYNCKITGYDKGEPQNPGQLKGVFQKEQIIGEIISNKNCGVFGRLNTNYNYKKLKKIDLGEAKIGEASIFTTIDGNTPKEYVISIVKIDYSDKRNKNFVIKINDNNLIDQTGGIVQGMSGSPIVQDGKLVGAITHVFTNDSTRGFGISIQNMLSQ